MATLVAGITGKILVAACEGKVRLPIMIELPECPTYGVVTGFALLSKGIFVRILAVTFIAGLGRTPEMRVGVTAFASYAGMLSQQRKGR